MTIPQEDAELRALLDEFVLFTDDMPHSDEPTELSLFLRQCGYPEAMKRLEMELQEFIKARDEQREREMQERVRLVKSKYTSLEHGIFAVMYYLDKPYPDDERWTPYSRFIHPKMIMVRKALDGEDVPEMWAIQESRRMATLANPQKQEISRDE